MDKKNILPLAGDDPVAWQAAHEMRRFLKERNVSPEDLPFYLLDAAHSGDLPELWLGALKEALGSIPEQTLAQLVHDNPDLGLVLDKIGFPRPIDTQN